MKYYLESSKQSKTCFALSLLSFVSLTTIVAIWQTPLWKDEVWYLGTVELLSKYGLSWEFLHQIPGPAGPLYTFIHFIFSPITQLQMPGVRFVNIFLFLLLLVTVIKILEFREDSLPVFSAFQLMAAPVLYVVVGTALTEVPAMVFFYLHVLLLFKSFKSVEAVHQESAKLRPYIYAAISGLLFGIAVLGRQPYLIAIVASFVFVLHSSRFWSLLLVYLLTASVLPLVVFAVWQGLVPPKTAFVGSGISITHGILSLSYGAFIYSIYSFDWIIKYKWKLLALITACVSINTASGFISGSTPLKTVAELLLPKAAIPLYTHAVSGVLAGIGIGFVFHIIQLIKEKHDAYSLYLYFSTIVLLLTPAKVTHMFAGRYVVFAVPLILAIAVVNSKDTYWKSLRIGMGCLLGFMSLLTTLYNAVRFSVG